MSEFVLVMMAVWNMGLLFIFMLVLSSCFTNGIAVGIAKLLIFIPFVLIDFLFLRFALYANYKKLKKRMLEILTWQYGNDTALHSNNRYCLWHRQGNISVDTFTVDWLFSMGDYRAYECSVMDFKRISYLQSDIWFPDDCRMAFCNRLFCSLAEIPIRKVSEIYWLPLVDFQFSLLSLAIGI